MLASRHGHEGECEQWHFLLLFLERSSSGLCHSKLPSVTDGSFEGVSFFLRLSFQLKDVNLRAGGFFLPRDFLRFKRFRRETLAMTAFWFFFSDLLLTSIIPNYQV